MCSHYQSQTDRETMYRRYGAMLPADTGRVDLWPGYMGLFLRRPPEHDVGDEAVPATEGLVGRFGLVPPWAKDLGQVKSTFNARAETVASKPSFRDAWTRMQRCIVPAVAVYEPDWRSGKAVATRISRADGQGMALAGLWQLWRNPEGQWLPSYTLLTINADAHPLMRHLHRPNEEKRMVVVLPDAAAQDWLHAPLHQAMSFLQPYPAEQLLAQGEPPRQASLAGLD